MNESTYSAAALDGAAEAPEQQVTRPVLLRTAREAAGLHIAALAAALKVPVKKLEALEAGRYHELPDMTFARALASSACRQLKIDPAAVLAQIPVGEVPHLGDSHQTINAPFRSQNAMASGSALAWLLRPAVLGAAGLLLAALVLVFLPSIRGLLPDSVGAYTPDSAFPVGDASSSNEVESTVVSPLQLDSSTLVVPPLSTADATAQVAPAVPAPTVPAATSTEAVTGNAGILLNIAATAETWVEVVNGSGSVVTQRVLKEGEAIDYSTSPPYAVVLGRADAARVLVRGKRFDIAPFARNNVARFEVK